MRRTLTMLMMLAAVGLMLAGCFGSELKMENTDGDTSDGDVSDGDVTDGDVDITLGEFLSSGCKGNGPMARETDADDPNMPEFNPIEGIAGETSLKILHHDAYYQCGADIIFTLDAQGRNLILTEVDRSTAVTDCMCSMDLSIEILNLVAGETYHVEVWDEFHDVLFGQVDVTVGDCPPQCETAADCWNLGLPTPDIDCEGGFQCVEGVCEFQCNHFDVPCQGDVDCPSGYHCEYFPGEPDVDGTTVDVDETGTDNSDPNEPVGNGNDTDPGMPPETACISDADCPAGMWCELMDCDMDDGTDCLGSGICVGNWPEPEGICMPNDNPNSCEDLGGFCNPLTQSAEICPPGFEPAYEYFYDVPLCGMGATCCVPSAVECRTDADCYEDWGTDPSTGEPTEPGYPGDGRWACIAGACEWINDTCNDYECLSDADCGPGFICMMYDGCSEAGDCCGGSVCEWVGDQCYSNWDCPDGMACINGVCTGDDCICPEYYAPVCGSDGITYDNPCFAECAGVRVLHEGPCEDCPDMPYPTCAPGERLECYPDPMGCMWCECVPGDNFCYSSYECPEGQYCTVDDGMCMSPDPECDENGDCWTDDVCVGTCVPIDDCACDLNYDPVCGTNGETYSNACFARCEGAEIAYAGECGQSCDCYDLYAPVCGANGETYPNDCYAFCDGVEILYPGECEPSCACPEYYSPVCGSDGNTYDNACFADCANVRIVHSGPCESEPECQIDSDCPAGFFCNTCPPDPTCPTCAVCGDPVCQPMDEPMPICEEIGGICTGFYPGAACPEGYIAIDADVELCGLGGMCCVPQ